MTESKLETQNECKHQHLKVHIYGDIQRELEFANQCWTLSPVKTRHITTVWTECLECKARRTWPVKDVPEWLKKLLHSVCVEV